jgi:hypothetical protein
MMTTSPHGSLLKFYMKKVKLGYMTESGRAGMVLPRPQEVDGRQREVGGAGLLGCSLLGEFLVLWCRPCSAALPLSPWSDSSSGLKAGYERWDGKAIMGESCKGSNGQHSSMVREMGWPDCYRRWPKVKNHYCHEMSF